MTAITDRFGRVFTVTTEGGEDVYSYTSPEQSLVLSFPAGWPVTRALFSIEASGPPNPMPTSPPAPSVPDRVTNFQARAVLLATPSGNATLLDVVEALLTAGKDGSPEGRLAWQAWEYANEVTRAGALVSRMASQLHLTPEQMDALFIAAASIEA